MIVNYKNKKLNTGVNSINARLNELGYSSYKEYLNSEHWKSIRSKFYKSKRFQRIGYKCAACKSDKNLNLHHKTYKHLGNEHLKDLILLCSICHKNVHIIHDTNNRKDLWGCTKKFLKN